MAFAFALVLSGTLYTLFWVHPRTDEGRMWVVQWRPLILRNGWTQTPSISALELEARVQTGFSDWLVDVRSAEERSVSILPGAMSVEAFDVRIQTETPSQIVAYCTIGLRSGQWVDKARGRGLPALNLTGGILGWTHIGGVLHEPNRVRGKRRNQQTRRVHVESEYWNIAAQGYEPVW